MINSARPAQIQFFSAINTRMLNGIARTSAVKKDNLRGEMFLVENMMQVTALGCAGCQLLVSGSFSLTQGFLYKYKYLCELRN